jgi:RNA polymerase sigma factor (TIGR02999 family)
VRLNETTGGWEWPPNKQLAQLTLLTPSEPGSILGRTRFRQIWRQTMAQAPQNVTQLLVEGSKGNKEALDQLLPIVYDELRRQAARYLRQELPGHTLQTTALIHEAYIRLIDQRNVQWQNRAQFFGIAAQLMRRILVDHARTKKRAKRGGSNLRVSLNEALAATKGSEVDLIALDQALDKLAEIDPQQSRVVELRFFSGLSVAETAEVLDISPATVKRDWSVAKAWLYREISGDEQS